MNQRHGSIDFDHVGIGTALKSHRLAVPLNQREYSWEEEHVLDLFHDLANAIDNTKPSYFLGTIVLTTEKDGVWEVADGQQRLATTTILLAAIRDYFHNRKDTLLVQDLENFLFTIVRETHDINPRLTLNVDDNDFFRNRVLYKIDTPERQKVTPSCQSHQRIEQAAQLAKKHIYDITSSHSETNKTARLNAWVKYVEQRAQVIILKVPDDLNAYVMFETLNDRGLKTSQSDLVKNYLFSQTEDRLAEAQQKWAKMIGALETLKEQDILITYLRHFLISNYGHTRERDVLERVKGNITGKSKTIDFLDSLASSASDYVAMLTPDSSKWNTYDASVRDYIRTMEKLEMIPMRPLVLSVISKFPKAQIEKALQLFVSWSVRFLIAGGGRSGSVEESFAKTAVEISAGNINSVNKMAKQVTSVIPNDALFENAFSTVRVKRNELARYYLRSLELYTKKQPKPACLRAEDFVYNLEHVLPETPTDKWPSFDTTLVAAYSKRLGNMVLLKAITNSKIGNLPFSKKVPYFKNSTFLLTQEVGQESVWEPKSIEERQKQHAKKAVKIWPYQIT